MWMNIVGGYTAGSAPSAPPNAPSAIIITTAARLISAASLETKYPPEEAPRAATGRASSPCLAAQDRIARLAPLTSFGDQQSPALATASTANRLRRASSVMATSSGRPTHPVQRGDGGQKFSGRQRQPWATKRTALAGAAAAGSSQMARTPSMRGGTSPLDSYERTAVWE
nr:unnamed protein product [Digitaria exilis]